MNAEKVQSAPGTVAFSGQETWELEGKTGESVKRFERKEAICATLNKSGVRETAIGLERTTESVRESVQ